MPQFSKIAPSRALKSVRYEIRGRLARRAQELERQGYEVLSLNIGNPGIYGFRTPETMRLAMIENLGSSEAYCGQKGIFPAREAVVMRQQSRGVMDTTAEEVFIGNGVSELIDLTLRALLNPGDEVLIPSPDYPLWTAATVLNGGKAVYYPCPEQDGFMPDVDALEKLITGKTRAIVIINPNNPTGAVYSRACLTRLAELAEKHDLLILADEIYDQMIYGDAEFVPMATLCSSSLCATFSGLSKVYRACGYRVVGWPSRRPDRSGDFVRAIGFAGGIGDCRKRSRQSGSPDRPGRATRASASCAPTGGACTVRQGVVSAVEEAVPDPGAPRRWLLMPSSAVDNSKVSHRFDDESFCMELWQAAARIWSRPAPAFNVSYREPFRITDARGRDAIDEVILAHPSHVWRNDAQAGVRPVAIVKEPK